MPAASPCGQSGGSSALRSRREPLANLFAKLGMDSLAQLIRRFASIAQA
jgi:hypothetical protein